MAQLFYTDANNTQVIHPDCIKLCPQLSILDEEEVLCLILSYDNFSPYRQFAEQERVYRASMHVWQDNNPKLFESIKWKNAAVAYQSLQYNPKLELIKTYQSKIKEMQSLIEAESSETAISKCLKIIRELRASIAEIETEVTNDIQALGQIKGDVSLSFIENLMKNQSLYEAKFDIKKK